MTRPVALLRAVPDSFTAALSSRHSVSIDVAKARAQHEAYRAILEAGGFATRMLPADEAHPDCPFVEDTAVVIGDRALATVPGHPSRRGETSVVVEALRELVRVETMEPPATLDGGDVLQVAGKVFVGMSARTNREGIEALAGFAAGCGRPVIAVPVPGGLHLKSSVAAVGDGMVVACGVEPTLLEGIAVIPLPGPDHEAANVVRLPDGNLVVAAEHPATARLLERRGFTVVPAEVSEFAKADGGLTCLSVRLRDVMV